MKRDTSQKSKSFFENNSWYHRTKILQEDGTVKYGKKGGFATSKEADKSYDQYEAEFKKAYRAYQIAHQINTEIYDIKLRYVNSDYLNSILEHTGKRSVAAERNGCSKMRLYFSRYPCYNFW